MLIYDSKRLFIVVGGKQPYVSQLTEKSATQCEELTRQVLFKMENRGNEQEFRPSDPKGRER